MIRTVVSGAAGRLGGRIVAHAMEAEDVALEGALVRAGSNIDGRPLPGDPDRSSPALTYTSDVAVIAAGTVLVEVAPRAAALEHGARAADVGAPVVLATTGFDAAELEQWRRWANQTAVLIAPNLSMGIAVLIDLVGRASRALAKYDVEVLELHHRNKRDAPSGTAWALGRAAATARGQDVERDAICARAGEIGPRGQAEIGLQSIRGGDIIGEHTVYFAGPTERLELTHRAANRDAFAAGAIEAIRFMGAEDRAPGTYTMRHVLGLDPLPAGADHAG